jgi:peptidoglycan LD-endopeptidase LytH
MGLTLDVKQYRFILSLLAVSLLIGLATACRNDDKKKRAKTDSIEIVSTPVPAPNAVVLNDLVTAIRDNRIDTTIAVDSFRHTLQTVHAYYEQQPRISTGEWVFPLEGYSARESIAEKDEGYIPGRYSFFQGNEHKGHPAIDIFIRDKNQDMVDDLTNKEVNVLSASAGMVIAAQTQWDTTSALRGGRYIWIYDPGTNYIFYYAHNNRVLVKPGQWLKPGDIIATCGRSGANAFKERSPTHLHFMLLQVDSTFYPRPVNPYPFLVQ